MTEESNREKYFHLSTTRVPEATEISYTYDPLKLRDKILPTEKKRVMYNSLNRMFEANPMDVVDHRAYTYGGIQQSSRKREFIEWGKKIAVERGIPSYNREMGIPMGQRYIEPVLVSNTDIMIEHDDISFYNNAALHQLVDDIKRTVIVGLDVPHRVIQLRLGKEISPESMNLYLETLQHTLAGGAVVQEHMAETHPGLSKDAYAKVLTGNDDLKDQFDRRWVLDINKEFHPERGEMLKRGIGDKLFNVLRTHTLRVHLTDGGAVARSAAVSVTMSFVAAYRLVGESVLSDIAYATRHAQAIHLGLPTWASRSRPQNEPGGIPFGYMADFCVNEAELPPIPFLEIATRDLEAGERLGDAAIECSAISEPLTDGVWYGIYMSGGVGFPSGSVVTITGNILSDFIHRLVELLHYNYFGHERILSRWDTIRPIVDAAATYLMECFEKYPTLFETMWGGALRTLLAGSLGGTIASFVSGDSMIGQQSYNYIIGLLMKEGWLRTGWGGQEVQDHVGLPYSASLRIEEGGLIELKGMNVPYISYTAGHGTPATLCAYGSMIGRGSAWAASPIVKAAFADRDLIFNFRRPTLEIAKGGLREFDPVGERDLIRPAK
ncbi:MAG: coenzyme-B sulfoethylthiotransferase subunit alpha [Candidatus Syntropharchaeia archaeon]